MNAHQRQRLTRWSQKAQDTAPAAFDTDRSARPRNPVESTALRMRAMETGHGGTSSSPLWRRSLDGVGASRMRLESRMPEAAQAWGHARDRLTSGRYAARESQESEATCHNTGLVPAGGLTRHGVEESPAACLPPPQADVPSRATCRGQHRTHASEVARAVMVCATVSGAS